MQSLSAQTWPVEADQRLELRWPERLPAKDAIYGRLGILDQLRLIFPENVMVFDDAGKVVISKVILTRTGRRELWFQAEPNHKYSVGWANVPKTTAPIAVEEPGKTAVGQNVDNRPKRSDSTRPEKPGSRLASSKAKEKVAPPEPRYTRPPGWSSVIPVVDVRPGEMFSRPSWEIKQEVVFNPGRRANDLLISRSQYRDFEMTLRVRPEAKGQYGVAMRISDPGLPMTTGLCWLIGVARMDEPKQGINRTLGLVANDDEGPLLKALAWNDLKISCQGKVVQLSLNGELCKTLQIPDGESPAGAVALVADSAAASFDDVKVIELPSQSVVLTETFSPDAAGGSAKLTQNWRTPWLNAASGFVRVINTGTAAARFEISARVHHSPWQLGPVSLGRLPVEPQQSTPWFWTESFVGSSAPYTLQIHSVKKAKAPGQPRMKSVERPEDAVVATVEFVHSLSASDRQFVRRIRLQDEPVVVEVQRAEFDSAADLRTSDEIGEELLERVQKLKFAGKRPEKLATGSPSGTAADLEAGRLLGFNAVSGSSQGFPADEFRKFGYRYVFADSHAIETREQGFGYKQDVVEAEFKKVADEWRAIGLADKVYLLNLFENAALDIDGQVLKSDPVNLQVDPSAWKQMMQAAGLKPADFIDTNSPPAANAAPDSPEYWARLKAVHPRAARQDPVGALKSLRLLAGIWQARFRNGTDAARRAFRRGVLTTADIYGGQYFLNGVGGIDPWKLYLGSQSLDVAKSRDDAALDALEEEYLIDLQRSAVGNSQKPVFGSFAAQSGQDARSANQLELRAMSALGAGARGLTFSAWGPRWRATSKWFSDDIHRLETIGRINHAAGWVEEILLEGRPAQGEVGILVSPVSDLWEFVLRDRERLDVQAERRRLHRLFRSLHYQVDFLNDEMLPRDSELDRYRVLVLAQPCLTSAVARRLEAWVNRGGVLIGSGSIGQFDEHCRPYSPVPKSAKSGVVKTDAVKESLFPVFGIKASEWRRASRRKLPISPSITLDVTEPIRQIEVDTAQVLHKFTNLEPAVTQRNLGKGQVIFCGFPLGAVYQHDARIEQEVLKGMQVSVRELLRPWLKAAGPPNCRTDHPMISARVVRSYQGNAIFLINSSGTPVSRVRVTVRIAGIQAAESLSRGKLAVEREGGESRFELPLERTDVIRIK